MLVQKQKEFQAKQALLGAVFAEAGSDYDFTKVTSLTGTTAEKVVAVQRMNDELAVLGAELEGLKSMADIAAKNQARGVTMETPAGMTFSGEGSKGERNGDGAKSLGVLFVEKGGNRKSGSTGQVVELPDFEAKTLLQTGAGFAPEVLRSGRIELTPERALQMVDVVPSTTTTETAVKWMKETVFTDGAEETAEGGDYGEAALQYAEATELVRKITVFLPVTDEQLEDVSGIQELVNRRLVRMLRARLDTQILNGDGTGINLRGILSTGGILTQAKGSDPVPDAIFKAMTKVMHTGYSDPDLVVLNPLDWQGIRLLRTADGLYIWGNPSEQSVQRIWGLPVIANNAMAQGTGLVGAFSDHSQVALRKGITLQVTNSHEDNFTKGIQVIRAEMRAVVVVYRPVGFCKVTGL